MIINKARGYLTLRRMQHRRLRLVAGGALCVLCVGIGVSAYSNGTRQFVPANLAVSPPSPLKSQQGKRSAAATAQRQPIAIVHMAGPDKPANGNTLRALAVRAANNPKAPRITAAERTLLEDYARETGRHLDWVLVDQTWQLLPALQTGWGDLIAGQNEDIQAGMQDQAIFTQPWAVSRQRVIRRRGADPLAGLSDLDGHSIAVRRNSPAWALLERYAEKQPDITLVAMPAHLSMASMLRQVALARYDLAVVNSDELGEYLARHPELSVAFDLPGGDSRVWAVHPDTVELHGSLNHYLGREALSRSVADIRFDDLPGIAERNMLRVITYQNSANYYLDESGELRGFEYELVRKFAKLHGLRVDVVVAPSQEDMLRWLLEGRGDLIAASVPAVGLREDTRLSLSRPYNYAAPLIIGRQRDAPLVDARDLEGRRVVLPAGSPYKRLLERYRQRGIDVELVETGPGINMIDILQRAADGIYDLTVIGTHELRTMLAAEPRARVHFPISEPLPHTWVMRAEDHQLQAAVNKYIRGVYRGRDYNVLHARYFDRPVKFLPPKQSDQQLLASGSELSPYDELVREHAKLFGFDWRLIVAQIYQESRFNPNAESSAGAVGLMQILPSTAVEIGISELHEPEAAIRAGVRYLSSLYERFEDKLSFEDRTWFALAAYNAGFHLVQTAREKAAAMDLDPDRWFDNVEKAMLSMSGSHQCRCGQPVVYVREIRARYHNYVRLTHAAQYASSEPRPRRIGHDT